jgi:hypothetical protein
MIAYCRNYLVTALQNIGLDAKTIYTRQEDFDRFKGARFALVEPGIEQLVYDNTRVAQKDDATANIRTIRYRLYKSELPIFIVLTGKNLDDAETLRQSFLKTLDRRFLDPDGNAIILEAVETKTLYEASIQNPREGYQIQINFEGGVYRDTLINLLTGATITTEIEIVKEE